MGKFRRETCLSIRNCGGVSHVRWWVEGQSQLLRIGEVGGWRQGGVGGEAMVGMLGMQIKSMELGIGERLTRGGRWNG